MSQGGEVWYRIVWYVGSHVVIFWYFDILIFWYFDILIFWYFDILIFWYFDSFKLRRERRKEERKLHGDRSVVVDIFPLLTTEFVWVGITAWHESSSFQYSFNTHTFISVYFISIGVRSNLLHYVLKQYKEHKRKLKVRIW